MNWTQPELFRSDADGDYLSRWKRIIYLDQRFREARRLGFRDVIVARGQASAPGAIAVPTIREALGLLEAASPAATG